MGGKHRPHIGRPSSGQKNSAKWVSYEYCDEGNANTLIFDYSMMAGTLLAPRNSSSRGLLEAEPVTFAQKGGSGLNLPPVQQDGMLPSKFHIDSKIFDVTTTYPPGELSQPVSIGDKIDCGPVDCLAECVY